MAKKNSGNKKGIKKGVAKHKIRPKVSNENLLESGIRNKQKDLIKKQARLCFDFLFKLSVLFHVSRFKRSEDGRFYVVEDAKYLRIHYVVTAVQIINLGCKLYILFELILKPVETQTLICIANCGIYAVGLSTYLLCTFEHRRIAETLNSWPQLLSCLGRNAEEKKLDVFEKTSASFKVIMLAGVVVGCGLGVPISAFIFQRLPVSSVNMLSRFGLLPTKLMPYWIFWLLFFAPIEFVFTVLALVAAVFQASVLLLSFDTIKIFIDKQRSIELRTVMQRKKMEEKLVVLTVFHRIVLSWTTILIPNVILGVSVGVIIALFITICYTNLPFYLYVFFPFTGFMFSVLIFWVSHDLLHVIQPADALLASLTTISARHLQHLPRVDKVTVIKRAKAMKPLDIPVGNFTDFSLAVTVSVYEEIINQLMFLLSL